MSEFNGLEEFFDYKNRLVGDLLTNREIVRLLANDLHPTRHPEDLVYKQVFPYEFVPDTVKDAATFVCCEVDIRKALSKTYMVPEVYIWTFTHKSLLRLPEGGARIDKLTSEIVKTINGSRMYGLGTLDLMSVRRYSPISSYQGRIITMETTEFNRLSPTGHPIPSNRKRG